MTVTVPLPDAAATRALGERLASVLVAGDLVVLTGGLGAGKTTLTQGIGAGLGVRRQVASHTFIIARVHPALADGPALVHVDAYRLTSPAEVDALDLDADVDDSVTVVEWGAGLVEDLTADRLEVEVVRPRGEADEPRRARLHGVGARWAGVDLAAVVRGVVRDAGAADGVGRTSPPARAH